MDQCCLGVAVPKSGAHDDVLLVQGGRVVAGAPYGAVAPRMAFISGGGPPFVDLF